MENWMLVQVSLLFAAEEFATGRKNMAAGQLARHNRDFHGINLRFPELEKGWPDVFSEHLHTQTISVHSFCATQAAFRRAPKAYSLLIIDQ